jgi:stress-induced morphogen
VVLRRRHDEPASTERSPILRSYDRDMATEPLQQLLQQAFPDATEVRVEDRTGGGDHFQVTVATPRFDELPLLEQHRLVNEALADPLRDGTIHELRIKTKGSE